MDRIPLYARAAARSSRCGPRRRPRPGHRSAPIELHVFVPDVDGTHRSVQEDGPQSRRPERAFVVRTTVRLSRVGDRLTVEATVDGTATTATRAPVCGGAPWRPTRTAWLDGEPVPLASGGARSPSRCPTRTVTWEAVIAQGRRVQPLEPITRTVGRISPRSGGGPPSSSPISRCHQHLGDAGRRDPHVVRVSSTSQPCATIETGHADISADGEPGLADPRAAQQRGRRCRR